MTFFSSLAWTGISFLLFTVLVAVISAWKTRDEQLDTAEGYFLAGRGLPGVVIAGSLLLTNLSAEQLVGLNGQSWKTNMGPIAWEVGSMFTLLVLAYYFLPKYLKMGAMTIPSLMEERYGKGTKTRFRPHHFPFTEPSCEMDVQCHKCGGVGCPTCKGEGWIELLGAGMIHPRVLEMAGIDPSVYSGWAFGIGLERTAMRRFKIADLRLIFENDVRFLEQF